MKIDYRQMNPMENQIRKKHMVITGLIVIFMIILLVMPVFSQDETSLNGHEDSPDDVDDPFRDIEPAESPATAPGVVDSAGTSFLLKEFILLYENDSEKDDSVTGSVGFEYYRLFSTPTRDVGDLNIQMRFVRDQLLTGHNNPAGYNVHWHNFYYTSFNPLGGFGNFNVRVGNAPIPFGLEPEVDTHNTLLQLSGLNNFGMKKDWGINAYGSLGDNLEYSASLTRGSGMHYTSKGNPLMGWGRISTSGKFNRENDSEIGLSYATGNRAAHTSMFLVMGSGMMHPMDAGIKTTRVGLDYRLWKNPYVITLEASTGRDNTYDVRNILAQIDYVDPGDKWQTSLQYRDFFWDSTKRMSPNFREQALTLGFDWFFSNTTLNRNILSVNYTKFFSRINERPGNQMMLQYYLYY